MMDYGTDVESAKQAYCSGFQHVGCGGTPKAYDNGAVFCTKCGFRQPCAEKETLGESLSKPAWQSAKLTFSESLFG